MKTSLKLIQPLSFVELLGSTKHYASIDSPSQMIVYELECQRTSSGFILTIIPSGCNEWLLGYNLNNSQNILYNIGATKDRTSIFIDKYDVYFGVRFTPSIFYLRDNIPSPYELFNTIHTSLPTIGSPETRLINQWKLSNSFDKRVELFQDYLNSFPTYHISSSVVHMLTTIEESNGSVLVSQLARDLCYSERHTNRLFLDTFGFGPKDYCKYVRFQNCLNEILSDPIRSNSEFIQNIGYSDQAHFQREFKSFTGITPKQYINLLIESTATI